MLNAHDNTRSMQTIRTNTAVIESFPMYFHHTEDVMEVRRMLNRGSVDRQYFIVTLKSDVRRAERASNSTSTVTPLAEVIVRNKTLRYVLEPQDQYPEIPTLIKDFIVHNIEFSVAEFMRSKFNALKENVVFERESQRWPLL